VQNPEIKLSYNHRKAGIATRIYNPNTMALTIRIHSNAYGYDTPASFKLAPGKSKIVKWSLAKSGNWYDFTVQSDNGFLHRFAGRVETGKNGISDPAMGTGSIE